MSKNPFKCVVRQVIVFQQISSHLKRRNLVQIARSNDTRFTDIFFFQMDLVVQFISQLRTIFFRRGFGFVFAHNAKSTKEISNKTTAKAKSFSSLTFSPVT